MRQQSSAIIRELILALALTTATSVTIEAATFSALYLRVPGVAGNEVPGLGGVTFGSPSNFSVQTTGSGSWGVFGNANLPDLENRVLIVNGQTIVRENTPGPTPPGGNYGQLDFDASINSASNAAFLTYGSGPSGFDNYVFKNIGGTSSIVAARGQPTGVVANTFWGSELYSPVIADNNAVGFIARDITGSGVTGTTNKMVVFNNSLVARTGVTIPGNQVGGARRWTNFHLGGFDVNANGSSYILNGTLTGDGEMNDVVVVNNNVVLQEPVTVPSGLFAPFRSASRVFMDGAGNWYAVGVNDDTQDWVVRNGVAIAAEGFPIVGGSEVWTQVSTDVFWSATSNDVGDYLIGGFSGPSYDDELLVLNGTEVVARAGDPLDLNGNGLFDDDAFIYAFLFHAGLTNDGTVYMAATIKNGAGNYLGEGVFASRVVPEPASVALLLMGSVVVSSFRRRQS